VKLAAFDSAPPPTLVDGLCAVAVHIERLRARVTLDCGSSRGLVDVTMHYRVGPESGNPLFDLRQRVQKCWLDGEVIAPADVAAHDVGGGPLSTVRILARRQDAGTRHSLRFRYQLAMPLAGLGGGYPPILQWAPGSEVRWVLGMSDLNPGRYLEAWFPANLVFDRTPLQLGVRVVGTPTAHVVISNAKVTAHGFNTWALVYPPYFTALSPLLEVRPAESVTCLTATAVLPVTKRAIAVEVWKPAELDVDLQRQADRIAGYLTDNERRYGPTLGDRFVAMFHAGRGGMEYGQATTTSVRALAHEVLHSWFGRGVSPASQADGWWDEGYAQFIDDGGVGAERFDFRDPPVELCSRRPLQRVTAANAYVDGSRLFRGVAALIGVAGLHDCMRSLYEVSRGTTLSTAQLEAHLVATSGETDLVDVFHRFVYGFTDPSPSPRLHLDRVWVHGDDDGATHRVHATVRNEAAGGACGHFVVVFALAGCAVAAVADFDLTPGDFRTVWARLPAAAGSADTVVASVHARRYHPVAAQAVPELI
jgi:hypothetical protein